MRARDGRALLGLWALAVALGGCSSAPVLRDLPAPGGLQGDLHIVRGEREAVSREAVVYLTRGEDPRGVWSRGAVTVERRREGFVPSLSAMARGRRLRLVNRGALHHRLFALTPDGRLDVPLDPHASASVDDFSRPGMLRFYCSLHADESFSVFVAPQPYFAVVDEHGRYAIRGVPPGPWRLHVWTEAVEGPVRPVRAGFFTLSEEDVFLDATRMKRP